MFHLNEKREAREGEEEEKRCQKLSDTSTTNVRLSKFNENILNAQLIGMEILRTLCGHVIVSVVHLDRITMLRASTKLCID